MTKIVLDSSICDRLQKLGGLAEICNDQGHIIGYFMSPSEKPGKPPAGLESSLAREEIERRKNCRTGRTTAEILSGLGLE